MAKPLEDKGSEHALIGSVLLEPSMIHNVADVQPEHMTGVEARVWGAMLALGQRGVPINTLSVRDELGGAYNQHAQSILSAATEGTPVVGNVEQYADAILDIHERRTAVLYAEELARAAYNKDADIDQVKADVAGGLLRSERRASVFYADELADLDLDEVRSWAGNPLDGDVVRGLSTGFRDLDRLLDGLWPGFFVLAGRTSMGKTALGTRLSLNIAANAPVYYVGLEHRPVVYWRRMVSQLAGISYKDVKRGLTPEQLRVWERTSQQLRGHRIALYNGSRKLSLVTASVNRAYHRWGGELGMVVIDNLGHIRTGDKEAYTELKNVSLALLEMSQRLRCTVLGLHQINRGVESRQDKRPTMSDLRDSGWIEETADGVGLLYRDDYYDPNTPDPNVLELAIAKNREDGATGVVKLYFDKQTGDVRNAHTRS
jgi:replicative DNA helicase